jgi:hypothetical protein
VYSILKVYQSKKRQIINLINDGSPLPVVGEKLNVLENFRYASLKIAYKPKKSIKPYTVKYIIAMTINTSLVEYTNLRP